MNERGSMLPYLGALIFVGLVLLGTDGTERAVADDGDHLALLAPGPCGDGHAERGADGGEIGRASCRERV